MTTLKERMLSLRKETPGVSNAQLAKEAGVKPPSVSGWFGGGSESLKWASVDAIARLYNVNPRWVATGEGPKRSKVSWPFSPALYDAVSKLAPEDLRRAENVLRSHLGLDNESGEFANLGEQSNQMATG